MIKFRKSQKEFALPFALLKGAVKAKNLIGGALNIGSQASMIAGTVQGAKGNQLMKQQNAEMERSNREQQRMEKQRLDQEKKWQEQQLKMQKQALKKGMNPFGGVLDSGGQPSTPMQMPASNIVQMAPPPIFQKAASDISQSSSANENTRFYSFPRDMALLVSRNRGVLINGVLAGAATTAGVYSVDRAIRADKKRRALNEEDFLDEDDYDRGSYENKEEEKSFSKRKVSIKSPIFSFVLGAAAPAVSYAAERKLEKDMMVDTKSSSGEEEFKKRPSFKEKSFATHLTTTGKVLNAVSIMTGGGGAKGMRRLGIQISAIGKKSGNKATKKLGQAILNNPNTSMALSIPAGLAILGGTFTLGDKIATKIAKKADPDAFKYIESKEKEVD